MNWSNPNKSGNSEQKSFDLYNAKKSEKVKNIVYHPDRSWATFLALIFSSAKQMVISTS